MPSEKIFQFQAHLSVQHILPAMIWDKLRYQHCYGITFLLRTTSDFCHILYGWSDDITVACFHIYKLNIRKILFKFTCYLFIFFLCFFGRYVHSNHFITDTTGIIHRTNANSCDIPDKHQNQISCIVYAFNFFIQT